jgi:rod shape determining protein RodA
MILSKTFKYFDWPFFAAVILLTLIGLLMIYSTGLSGKTESILWIKQTAALVVGVVGLFFLASLDYRFFAKNSTILYLLALFLLLVVLLLGHTIRGSTRWFDLGAINFQPAEFSKLAIIILLAKFFQTKKQLLAKFGYVLQSFVYVFIPLGLIMLQPDLGSAIVHLAIWFGMLLISPMPRRYFLYLLVIFLVVSSVVWQFLLAGYQKDRVRSFIDPTADPRGRGYNALQSVVAVGSGGWFGSGLARGLQSQLKFLPERQTDFIFASTTEELGLIGGGLVIILLVFVLLRVVKILREARDSFGAYIAAGIFFLIFSQSVVNIGMNLGLVPVTGITLPFLSYGGSSLVITFWLIGILENIAQNSVPVRFG